MRWSVKYKISDVISIIKCPITINIQYRHQEQMRFRKHKKHNPDLCGLVWTIFSKILGFWYPKRYVRKLLVRFWCIKDIYPSRSIYVNNNDLLRPNVVHDYNLREFPPRFMVNYNYLPHLICLNYNHNWHSFSYFHDGAWIVLGSNTINENSILPSRCCCATSSRKRVMIFSS